MHELLYCCCDVQLGVMALCVYHMVYVQYANVYVLTVRKHVCKYSCMRVYTF